MLMPMDFLVHLLDFFSGLGVTSVDNGKEVVEILSSVTFLFFAQVPQPAPSFSFHLLPPIKQMVTVDHSKPSVLLQLKAARSPDSVTARQADANQMNQC